MKTIAILSLLPCLYLTGCQYEPIPQKPEYTFAVTVDSVPSGAGVYTIDSSGYLGTKLGETPLTHYVGISGQYIVSNFSGKRDTNANVFIIPYGEGLVWENKTTIALQLVILKENYEPQIITKDLFHPTPKWGCAGYTHSSFSGLNTINKRSVTVPLTSLSQANFNRQLEVQQNINIRNEKDSLDTVNSALDALIKLRALTPVR